MTNLFFSIQKIENQDSFNKNRISVDIFGLAFSIILILESPYFISMKRITYLKRGIRCS